MQFPINVFFIQSFSNTCVYQKSRMEHCVNFFFRIFAFSYFFLWFFVLFSQNEFRIHQEIIFFNILLTLLFLLFPTKIFLTFFLFFYFFTILIGSPFLLTHTYGCPEGMVSPKPFLDYITSVEECVCVEPQPGNAEFKDCISKKDRITFFKCLNEWGWSERECMERIMWYSEKRK
jgi:hypothetical protein